MRKRRRSTERKTSRPQSKTRHSSTSVPSALITRRRDPLTREWVPLAAVARQLGFDWRTLRKHIVDEPFVRVLGRFWYVRYADFLDWWERQRPRKAAASGR